MPAEVAPVATPQPYDREKRVLLTRAQEQRLGEFLRRLEHATGGLRITSSELSRGLLVLVFQAEDEILRSAAAACARARKHPATADRSGKELLEGELAAIILDAVKGSTYPLT